MYCSVNHTDAFHVINSKHYLNMSIKQIRKVEKIIKQNNNNNQKLKHIRQDGQQLSYS